MPQSCVSFLLHQGVLFVMPAALKLNSEKECYIIFQKYCSNSNCYLIQLLSAFLVRVRRCFGASGSDFPLAADFARPVVLDFAAVFARFSEVA